MTTPGQHSSLPTEHYAVIGELQVRYLEWRSTGQVQGAPILALHGLASSANWYERLAARLCRNHSITAPDQRGHGQTSQAASGYDWQTLAGDAVRVLDHLGLEQAVVLGHSWGGNVAINVAARFPERVSKLVMIDGGFLDGHLLPDASWEVFQNRYAPRNVSGTQQEFLDRISQQLGDCWDEDLERVVLTMVYEDEEGQIQDILRPQNHAQVLEAMWGEPPSVTLPNIQCPTLIVPAGPRPDRAGSSFNVTKTVMVEAAAKAVPNNRVHWIPETIHDIGYHRPGELAAVIEEFLEGA